MNKDEILDKAIRRVPDFPKPGILFFDVTSILTNPPAFKHTIDRMVEIYSAKKPDAIAAVESRGFLFGAPLAEKLGIPLVLIRKKGKLPGEVFYDIHTKCLNIKAMTVFLNLVQESQEIPHPIDQGESH